MEKYANLELNYRVTRANEEQIEWLFNKHWKDPEIRQRVRERFKIFFIAVDENENIIGRLMIEEKPVPPPQNGTNWWISSINTYMEYRRKGVATAMLKEAIKQAEESGVLHLQGTAEPTRHACMFWYKNNFILQRYAKKQEDENNTETFGNFPHVLFYRIKKTTKTNIINNTEYQIIRADKEQIEYIFNEYLLGISPSKSEFLNSKKEDLFALAAVNTDGKMVGFILALAQELNSPLDGMEWMVPYIFVSPELRRQGIGSVLLNELIKTAAEEKAEQLLFIGINENEVEFWNKNNLDLFFWKQLSEQNTIITAGVRLS